MNGRGRRLGGALLALAALAAPSGPAMAQQPPRPPLGEATRVRILEDREAIRELLNAYGATLDARDFDGFAGLFARDGEYVSGPTTTRGGAAAAAMLKDVMAKNPMGFREPNFHVFFNEDIRVAGDRATATSMSLFIVPDDANAPRAVLMARYRDDLVREDGRWKFARRVVGSNIPAPR